MSGLHSGTDPRQRCTHCRRRQLQADIPPPHFALAIHAMLEYLRTPQSFLSFTLDTALHSMACLTTGSNLRVAFLYIMYCSAQNGVLEKPKHLSHCSTTGHASLAMRTHTGQAGIVERHGVPTVTPVDINLLFLHKMLYALQITHPSSMVDVCFWTCKACCCYESW